MADTPMRFGIVGTGFVSDWFVAACRRAGAQATAICSRDPLRGREFAARHGLGVVTMSVEDLARHDEVDAVYVASPIGAHAAHVTDAVRGGKHVLCEKTLTTSPDTVRELFWLAQAQDRVLLEAVRPVHDPAYRAIAAALPRLGTLRNAHFEKCQYSSRYPAFLRGEVQNALDPASGNSALRDIGIYCLHPALTLFGAPAGFTGVDYLLHNGFEAGGSLLLDYGSMAVTCTYSKVARSAAPSVVEGEDGTMTIDSVADPADVRIVGLDGDVDSVLSGPPKSASETLNYPVEEFVRLCAAGDVRHRYRAQSIEAERIVDGVLRGGHAPATAGSGSDEQGEPAREDPRW